jgi:hypothetical protein
MDRLAERTRAPDDPNVGGESCVGSKRKRARAMRAMGSPDPQQ